MEYYRNYTELSQHARADIDFTVEAREGASGILVMAIHGGGIEPGTSELADAIAGSRHGYYSFRGLMPSDNRILHLTNDPMRSFRFTAAAATFRWSISAAATGNCAPVSETGCGEPVLRCAKAPFSRGHTR